MSRRELVASGLLGGLVFGLADGAMVLTHGGTGAVGSAVGLLGVHGVLGLVWGCALAGLRTAGKAPSRGVRLVGRALVLIAAAWFVVPASEELLTGPRFRDHPLSAVFRGGVPILILMVVIGVQAAAFRAAGWRWTFRRVLAAGLVMAAVVLTVLDGTVFRGQYPETHRAIRWLGFASLAPGLWLWGWGRFGRSIGLAAVLVGLSWAGCGFSSSSSSTWIRHSLRGADLLTLWNPSPELPRDVEPDAAYLAEWRERPARDSASRRELDGLLGPRSDWNVLWITVDTLRADRVSAYGYGRETSPNMDALAASGTLFTRAWSQNPTTHFSFESAFYGRYPRSGPLLVPEDPSGNRQTLALRMGRAGVHTVAVPAIPAGALRRPEYRVLTRDFQQVSPSPLGERVDAEAQASQALEFLRGPASRDQRWFLWLHFMEPHAPYVHHRRFGFGASPDGRYDSEVRAADESIGKVLDALRESSLDGRTVVVLHGDHGEALGDHRQDYHGASLYEEQIHVPLIIRAPGVSPRRIATPVENVDLAPTVLALMGLPADPDSQGDSLISLMLRGDEARPRSNASFAELPVFGDRRGLFAEGTAVLKWPWKLLYHRPTGRVELYDLSRDPGELADRSDSPEAPVRAMLSLEAAWREATRPPAAGSSTGSWVGRQWRSFENPESGARWVEHAWASRSEAAGNLGREWLADPELPSWARFSLLRFVGWLDPARVVRHVRPPLRDAESFGWVRAAVEALWDLPREERRRAVVELGEDLRRHLEGPPCVGRHVAMLLASVGDDGGRSRLQQEAETSPDDRVQYLVAVALTQLGDPSARKRLRRGLVRVVDEPGLLERGLDALAEAPEVEDVPDLLGLAEDPYGGAGIQQALLRLLEKIDLESGAPLQGALLKTFDLAIRAEARQGLLNRGLNSGDVARREALATVMREGMDLLAQGDALLAERRFEEGALLASPGYAPLFQLRWARSALARGDRSLGERLCQEILATPSFRPWHDAASNLLRCTESRLELSVELAATGTLEPGRSLRVLATVRGQGGQPVPGGVGGLAPVFRLWLRDSKGQGVPTVIRPVALPEGGLEPGEALTLLIPGEVPAAGSECFAEVRVQEPWRVDGPVSAVQTVLVRPFLWDAWSVTGPAVVFGERSMGQCWFSPPSCAPAEREADGSVTWMPLGPFAFLASPGLSPHQSSLEIVARLRPVTPREGPFLMSASWIHGADLAEDPMRGLFQLDTEDGPVTATLPPREGSGVTRLRLAMGEDSHPVQIRSLGLHWR